MSVPIIRPQNRKKRLSEPQAGMLPLGPRHKFAMPDKEILTIHGFENYEDIINMFVSGDNTKILDRIENCFYFKTLSVVGNVDAKDLGINALVGFIKTKFHNNELVLKRDNHGVSPSFIREAVISSIMTREYVTQDKPSFCLGRMFAAFTCRDQGYMILERYAGPLHKFPHVFADQVSIAYIIIQVLTTLRILQQKYKFTHYDLHTGNILLHSLTKNDVFNGKPLLNSRVVFYLNGYQFPFNDITYIVKIIDFGIARIEMESQTLAHRKYEQFSPYYDFAFFIHSLYYELSLASRTNPIPRVLFKTLSFIDKLTKLSQRGRPLELTNPNYEKFFDTLCQNLSLMLYGGVYMSGHAQDYTEMIVM